jgi:hypothetical protein
MPAIARDRWSRATRAFSRFDPAHYRSPGENISQLLQCSKHPAPAAIRLVTDIIRPHVGGLHRGSKAGYRRQRRTFCPSCFRFRTWYNAPTHPTEEVIRHISSNLRDGPAGGWEWSQDGANALAFSMPPRHRNRSRRSAIHVRVSWKPGASLQPRARHALRTVSCGPNLAARRIRIAVARGPTTPRYWPPASTPARKSRMSQTAG